MSDSIYNLKATRNNATEQDFKEFEGKAILVVNTASKCGFTPQYKGLESLYKAYKDKGLVVLGFPCDQFAHQEPGDDEAIAQFCERNFGVSFPLMAKVKVNGDDTHPVFQLLKKKAPGAIGGSIKWNFTKFLVSKDGQTVKRYAPTVEPEAIEADIMAALQQ
jgi:glutathione peroxidase